MEKQHVLKILTNFILFFLFFFNFLPYNKKTFIFPPALKQTDRQTSNTYTYDNSRTNNHTHIQASAQVILYTIIFVTLTQIWRVLKFLFKILIEFCVLFFQSRRAEIQNKKNKCLSFFPVGCVAVSGITAGVLAYFI